MKNTLKPLPKLVETETKKEAKVLRQMLAELHEINAELNREINELQREIDQMTERNVG